MKIFELYKTKRDRKDLTEIFHAAQRTHPFVKLPDFFYEKDIWITEILHVLYDRQLFDGFKVAFKGGTALSKCWSAIDRFSEDIDLSIHWPDLTGITEDEYNAAWEKTTKNRTQNDRFRKEQQARLIEWSTLFTAKLNDVLAEYEIPELHAQLVPTSCGEKIEIQYPHVTGSGTDYQLDYILLEFGGRNRGCPTQAVPIKSYLSFMPLPDIVLPKATPEAYDIGYIAWEKLTALHQFCTQTKMVVAERQARHWYDVCSLLQRHIVDPLQQLDAMHNVISMKAARWAVPGVCYQTIAKGNIKLVPDKPLFDLIAADHQAGIAGGLFFGEPPSFDEIMATLQVLENTIKRALS